MNLLVLDCTSIYFEIMSVSYCNIYLWQLALEFIDNTDG
jgi:hypothetical protein